MVTVERFVCNMFQENCYVVSDDSGECVIIDCGALYTEEQRAIQQYIERKHLTPVRLVATHGHIDHNYGNTYIYKVYGLKPWVHAADEQLMQRLGEQALMFTGVPLDDEQPPIGKLLTEGDTIAFGTNKMEVVSTPGHSPGSVVLLCQSLAFTGDTLFHMSIGRTDLMLGSQTDIEHSLHKMALMLPPETTVLPGHGPQTTMADELRFNPYMR